MEAIDYISNITSISTQNIILIIKTICILIFLDIFKLVLNTAFKRIKNNKLEYITSKKTNIIINILKVLIILTIWSDNISKLITLISVISAAFTIAIRDIIFNYISGLYIKIAKPFSIEDRIEINEYKGDVVNINNLNFEILEVENKDFTGQSTGVIIHIPNSIIFSYPLRNYDKGFKYIWNEIKVDVTLDSDIEKTKSVLYQILNKNDIIKPIPNKMKNQIDNISNKYRIYYNQFEPTIYIKYTDECIQFSLRYPVHPKKSRYVNSSLWKYIILAHQNNEITLYKKS